MGKQKSIFGALGVLGGAALVGASGTLGAGLKLARDSVTPSKEPVSPVRVTDVTPLTAKQRAALRQWPAQTTEDAQKLVWLRGQDAGLPGAYSFHFGEDGGHARLGEVLARRGKEYARPLLASAGAVIAPGVRGRINGWWFTDPHELGYPTEEIRYTTELGPAKAWIVSPHGRRKIRWAVHVHGRGSSPAETLRAVAPLAAQGITNLIITYRNDVGAPAGHNGRYAHGFAEARDVDAAVQAALARGAKRVTLVGWSMGGTAALLAANLGEHRAAVDGVILDSPALDWPALLRHHVRMRKLPGGLVNVGIHMLERGVVGSGEPGGIPFASLVPDFFARDLRVPVLIQASSGDTFVPVAGAREFAALRPDLVQLRVVEDAEHVKLWNVDPSIWERNCAEFAAALPKPPYFGR